MNLLADPERFKCSVSSVLNKDVKQHGKSFLFDGCDDTAWSSDQGTPQWISVKFEPPVSIEQFQFQFQGGFVGENGCATFETTDGTLVHTELFYPDDINAKQQFPLNKTLENIRKIQFTFEQSSDFFGRIIIYHLEIY